MPWRVERILRHDHSKQLALWQDCWNNKAQTLKQARFQGYPKSTICVQVPVGSRNSAIHNAYRTSLRPSSLFEPRHPSLKVVRNARKSSWQLKIPKNHSVGKIAVERAFAPPPGINRMRNHSPSHDRPQNNSH